jgi:hypothetical protein
MKKLDEYGLPKDEEDLPPIPPALLKLLEADRDERKKTGRPSNLTPRRVRRLLYALSSAASIKACAEWSGIGFTVYRRHFTEGGKEGADTLHRVFRASCVRARESGELELVEVIKRAAKTEWRAAHALLEAKKPKRYRRQIAASVQHGGNVTVKGLGDAFAEFFKEGEGE